MDRRPSDEEIAESSAELARALEQIAVRAPERDFDELARELDRVEEAFTRRVAAIPSLVLEVRRRVAEQTLYAAIDKECPPEKCRALLSELEALGFTNLEKKANVYLIYARDCLELDEPGEGLRVLEPLVPELERELVDNDLELYRHLLRTTLEVLEELRASRP